MEEQSSGDNIIAKVGNKFLYAEDILYEKSMGDSIKIFNQQVNNWIKKQLIIQNAFQNLEIKKNINKKVENYKDDLILFEFEKYVFSNNKNFDVTAKEIESYYNENINDFILPYNLVKTLYAKLPVNAPSINSFRRDILNYPKSDLADIRSYCYQFAEKSYLEDTIWVKFEDLIINTPFPREIDKTEFLKYRKFYEFNDDGFIHFIRLLDKKVVGDFSPISFEADVINTILINNRKQELFDKLQDSIFSNSLKGIDYDIY
tara:strand:+ start:1426 stop:2205 length:780 start_codon:yes stop_codon:yes gene_type:complete